MREVGVLLAISYCTTTDWVYSVVVLYLPGFKKKQMKVLDTTYLSCRAV